MSEKLMSYGEYLSRLLGDMANGLKSAPPDYDDFNWEEFYKFANRHNVANMLYYQIKDFELPKEAVTAFGNSCKKAISRGMRQEFMSAKICGKLEQENIEYILLKGATLQKLYPHEYMRISTDVDIYIQHKDREKVKAIMLAEEFENAESTPDQDVYHKNPIYSFEMHYALTSPDSYLSDYFRTYFERSQKQNESCCKKFCDGDLYIYTLYHLYKHYAYGGCGVRLFLDLYLLEKTINIDTDYIKSELQKTELYEFSNFVRRINKVLFESAENAENDKLLLKYIFSSGTFGRMDVFMVANIQKQNENNDFNKNRKKYFLNIWFPPLNIMKEKYAVLKKLPFLLPFCWVFRAVTSLFFKRDTVKSQLDDAKFYNSEKSDILDNIKKISGVHH